MPRTRGSIAATVERPTISVVIVAHDSLSDLQHSLPTLIGELGEEDELIVVDSGSIDQIEHFLPELTARARLISAHANVGFAAGANLGAAAASGELIVFLNPDVVVQPGWGDAMRAAWGTGLVSWMPLILMASDSTINTSGGVLHFSGVGWAGQAGQPASEAPTEAGSVGFVSGACLAIPASEWRRVGGFPDWYFMYCEDVDLSLRLRLRGGKIGIIPAARVVHSYDFDKGPYKWRMLERNRLATVIRCYPGPLLMAVFPALVAAEIMGWALAFRGHRGTTKALATLDVLRAVPRLLSERRAIQRDRTIDAVTFSDGLTSHLESEYLDLVAHRWVQMASQLYWWLARRLVRVLESPRT